MRGASSFSRSLLVLAGAALAFVLVACGGTSAPGPGGPAPKTSASGPSTPQPDPDLVAALPASVVKAGVIEVGTSATYEPMIFRGEDGKSIVGFDVDLFNAVAAKFGMTTHWTSADFGDLLTGITNGTYDIGASSISVTPERAQVMKLVSYLDTGARWAIAAGNPGGVDPAKACGLTVGATTDSRYQTEDLPARNKSCPAGQKIKIVGFASADEGMEAAKVGRIDAMVADDAVISYDVKHSNGSLELVGDLYDRSHLGYGLPESSEKFAEAISKALESLKEDGTYDKILAKWGLGSSAAGDFTVSD